MPGTFESEIKFGTKEEGRGFRVQNSEEKHESALAVLATPNFH